MGQKGLESSVDGWAREKRERVREFCRMGREKRERVREFWMDGPGEERKV